jgi:hypothetical protein
MTATRVVMLPIYQPAPEVSCLRASRSPVA